MMVYLDEGEPADGVMRSLLKKPRSTKSVEEQVEKKVVNYLDDLLDELKSVYREGIYS